MMQQQQHPQRVSFDDLNLHYTRNDRLSYDTNALRRYLKEQGIEDLSGSESFEDIGPVVVAWYLKHRAKGGKPNEAIEYMFALVDLNPSEVPSKTH